MQKLRPILRTHLPEQNLEVKSTVRPLAEKPLGALSLPTLPLGNPSRRLTPLLRQSPRPYRILDFDTECRPLSYLGGDYTTGEVTAIAASWEGSKKMWSRLLGRDDALDMLQGFVALYNQADVVTGHYVRKHDLPILNGALLEYGLPPLGRKMVSDTYSDLVSRKYLSASQENLAAMFGLSHRKEHMNQVQWREANRLTPKGLKETKRRVAGDVRQHKELRQRLIEVGALGPPRLWKP